MPTFSWRSKRCLKRVREIEEDLARWASKRHGEASPPILGVPDHNLTLIISASAEAYHDPNYLFLSWPRWRSCSSDGGG